MNPQEFFRAYLPYARSVSEQTGIDPRLVLAQAALETGYGKSAPNYNFFGIKGRGQTQQTKEFRNGQWVTENAGFRSYSDPSGSFADYADLMMNSARYEPVRAGRTLEEQIAAMASSGYATDPNYGAKLANIAGMIDYNSPELIGADAMRAIGRDTGAIPVTQRRTANAGNTTGTEAPMGLLNMGQPAGQQAPAQAQGNGFWDNFAGGILADPDRRARLAMAFEGMSLNPNQSVIALAQSDITDRKTKATLNKTIEWLRGQPNGEAYIRMIEAGASPAQVIQALMQAQAGPEQTSAMKNYEFLVRQGMPADQAMSAAFSGGTTVNVGGGPEVGTIPQGYELFKDPETGAYRMQPIAGGPADTSAKVAAGQEQTGRAAGVVLEDIGRLRTILEESTLPVTGMFSLMSNVAGTNAFDAAQLAQTIKGNIGFDRLQQMRDASPTGGALGAINQQELDTLQSVLGSLNLSQSQSQLEYNLNRLEQIYIDIMRKASAYPNASQFGFGVGGGSSDGFSVTGQVGG